MYFIVGYWKPFVNDLPIIYQIFTNPIFSLICWPLANHLPIIYLISCYIVDQLPIILPMDYQSFTNAVFMLLSLPVVYQSFANQPHPFYYIDHIAVAATNYSNLLYQCFANHYHSDPVLYITSLPMITNKLPIYHYQS